MLPSLVVALLEPSDAEERALISPRTCHVAPREVE